MDARGADEGLSDPFWSAVRRRHTDIDIVVLPQEAPPAKEPEPDPSLTDSVPAEFDRWLAHVWPLVAGDVARPPAESRWVPGAVTGSLNRTALLAVESVDEVTALQALAGAARALEQDGWHVLAPERGMPRVLAGRDEGPARRELQIVYVPERLRFAVLATLGPLVVGPDAARAALETGA